MNTRSIPIILLLSALVVFAPAMTCKQTDPKAQAYQTLKSIQIVTDAAIKTYRTAVVSKKVSIEKQVKIDMARAQYQAAFRLAVKTARNDMSKAAPVELQGLADQLILLISSL